MRRLVTSSVVLKVSLHSRCGLRYGTLLCLRAPWMQRRRAASPHHRATMAERRAPGCICGIASARPCPLIGRAATLLTHMRQCGSRRALVCLVVFLLCFYVGKRHIDDVLGYGRRSNFYSCAIHENRVVHGLFVSSRLIGDANGFETRVWIRDVHRESIGRPKENGHYPGKVGRSVSQASCAAFAPRLHVGLVACLLDFRSSGFVGRQLTEAYSGSWRVTEIVNRDIKRDLDSVRIACRSN